MYLGECTRTSHMARRARSSPHLKLYRLPYIFLLVVNKTGMITKVHRSSTVFMSQVESPLEDNISGDDITTLLDLVHFPPCIFAALSDGKGKESKSLLNGACKNYTARIWVERKEDQLFNLHLLSNVTILCKHRV